ncbi:hypothetical protein [Natronorarus salvus]|uniref:hypothetical protein n=1 Tax=Natronorarus salvus TaxID=3117733 RepID=UPI002F26AD33
MDTKGVLFGEPEPRRRVAALALTLPALASVAFLLGVDVVLGFTLLTLSLVVALYAGARRAGALVGLGTVYLTVLWRFVFPPLVGYVRSSMDTRYTPPRALGYKLHPRGELIEGLTHGPIYALGIAVVLGGGVYLVGTLIGRLY